MNIRFILNRFSHFPISLCFVVLMIAHAWTGLSCHNKLSLPDYDKLIRNMDQP
jgi:hypothetical protein